MKKGALVLIGIALVVAAYSAAAWSAAPPSPTEKALLKNVKVLQAQVKTLQSDVKKLKAQSNSTLVEADAAILLSACGIAVNADSLQGTWQVIDQLASATQAGKTYFGPQTPVVDSIGGQPICQTIGVSRSQSAPPTVAQHNALLALLRSLLH
jgi:hypothetical protein